MATIGQLGQARDSTGDTATTVYTVPSNVRATNLIMTIANTTATADDYRIFQDDNGTTADASTALFYDVAIAANTTIRVSLGPMSTATGTIRVSSSTANAITFTLHGSEERI